MAAKLRAVPDAPPRAVGLVRVSKERDEMLSPELQRTAIEDHCARRGFQIVGWIEGIDESGSQSRSRWWRKLDEGVGLVETGDADVLVVWRFSRAARQRLRWATAVDRVEVAGGLLESATEPLDTSTASGRLARGMLSEFAAYEAEVIGNTWREVHARRTSRGLPANGKPRFGYQRVDGLHRPDPETGPVLAALYRRYLAGESVYSLVGWLNRERILTVAGYSASGPGPWSDRGLRKMLDSGFGAGFLIVHGTRQRGAHEPVIDEATWAAYLAARAGRRTLRRAERSQYLLSGLVCCLQILDSGEPCGSPMSAGHFSHGTKPMFRCIRRTAYQTHPGGYVMMSLVEDAVLDWLRELAGDVERSADAAAAELARAARRKVDAEQLRREVLKLDDALTRLEVNRASAPDAMPAAVFEAARGELLEQRRAADERRLAAEAEAVAGRPAQTAARLLAEWETLPVEQRRGTLRELIARVEVTPGRPRASIVVVPKWAGENRA